MPKGHRLKPEQIVTLLHQIDVLTVNGNTHLRSLLEKMSELSKVWTLAIHKVTCSRPYSGHP